MKVRRSLARTRTGLLVWAEPRERLSIMGAAHLGAKGPTALADPADNFRWDTRDQGLCWNVLCDHRPRRDHRVPFDREAAENRCICANGGSIFDFRGNDFPVGTRSPWIQVVREAGMGSHEDAIPNRDSTVQSREVLDFAVVSYDDRGIDVHVLSDVTPFSDSRALPDLGPVPDRCVFPDLCLGGVVRRRMNSARHEPASRISF